MEKVISHLNELRSRLISTIVIFLLFFTLFSFLSRYLIKYLLSSLPKGIEIVVMTPMESLFGILKVSIFVSILATLPFALYHIVRFVKPALKKNERKFLKFLPFSLTLFFVGFFCCYFLLIRIFIPFFVRISSVLNVRNLWSLVSTIDFIFMSCVIFGLFFQLPLLLLILEKIGIVNYGVLRKQRKTVYVLVFIFSAVITPTVDPITQIVVSVPLILLYEISLILMKLIK